MKSEKIAAILALACCLALPQWLNAAKPKQPTPAPAESELLKACRARLVAMNRFNVTAIDQYTHRDYVGTGLNGQRSTKAELLKRYAPHSREPPNSYGQMDDVQVRIYGSTGIVSYRVELKERFGDRDIVTAMRWTDVFLKEDGRWQEVSAQLTQIPISRLTPATTDPQPVEEFAGDYEITPDNVEHFTVNDTKLASESFRGTSEALPLGPDKFFFREDLGQVTFARDESGKVTGYSYQRCDGQLIAARKVR